MHSSDFSSVMNKLQFSVASELHAQQKVTSSFLQQCSLSDDNSSGATLLNITFFCCFWLHFNTQSKSYSLNLILIVIQIRSSHILDYGQCNKLHAKIAPFIFVIVGYGLKTLQLLFLTLCTRLVVFILSCCCYVV